MRNIFHRVNEFTSKNLFECNLAGQTPVFLIGVSDLEEILALTESIDMRCATLLIFDDNTDVLVRVVVDATPQKILNLIKLAEEGALVILY